MIKQFTSQDLPNCVQLFIKTFNCPPWNDQWTKELAERYLLEIIDRKRFVGFLLYEGTELVGASFGCLKSWWSNDELLIEEFFISPDHQHQGFGQKLIKEIIRYTEENDIPSIILLTNKEKPAFDFYKKNNFEYVENFVLMYRGR